MRVNSIVHMYLSKKFQILRSLEKVDDPFHMQVQNRAMFFERQRYYLAVFSPSLLASAKLQNKSLSERAKINHVSLFIEQSISPPKFCHYPVCPYVHLQFRHIRSTRSFSPHIISTVIHTSVFLSISLWCLLCALLRKIFDGFSQELIQLE